MRSFIVIATTLVTGSAWSQTLTAVNPSSANRGEQLTVTISGSGTLFTQATTTVYFEHPLGAYLPVVGYTVVSNTSIEAELDTPLYGPCGTYSTYVYNGIHGLLSLPSSFEVICNQNLISVSPTSAERGEQLTVTITGSETYFTQASNTVIFQQGTSTIQAISYNAVSNTVIEAEFDIPESADCRMYSTNVFNDLDGLLTLASSFEVTCQGDGIKDLYATAWPDVMVYPVPLQGGEVTVSFGSQPGREVRLEVLSADGRIVREFESIRGTVFRFDLSNAPVGIYLVRVSDGLQTATRKLIKSY